MLKKLILCLVIMSGNAVGIMPGSCSMSRGGGPNNSYNNPRTGYWRPHSQVQGFYEDQEDRKYYRDPAVSALANANNQDEERDRVIRELQAENRRLREQINYYQLPENPLLRPEAALQPNAENILLEGEVPSEQVVDSVPQQMQKGGLISKWAVLKEKIKRKK